MKRVFYILLLLAGCVPIPAMAQAPAWTDFYMSKVGSYYSLNVYRTPIRAWMLPDTIFRKIVVASATDTTWIHPTSVRTDSLFGHLYGDADSLGGNPWTSYLRSDVADTTASDYSMWFGHYGTRTDSSGIFFFPFPVSNPFGQGWAFGASPWCNIKQDSNTVLDVQLENGAIFSVDRGGGMSGDGGFRIYRYSVGQDSFYIKNSIPFSFFRSTREQKNDKSKTHKYPLAVYGVGGDTIITAVCDTNWQSPIQTFDTSGAISAYFGIKSNTDSLSTKQLTVKSTDTLTISHANDTTYINTTAGTVKLNKELTVPLSHGFGYFKDSSATVLVSSAGVYSKITNATNTLFNVGETDNMTFAGDSIIIRKRGAYLVHWSFTLSGTNTKDFRIETQYNGVGQAGKMGASGTGAGNLFNIASTSYIDVADSAGRIGFWVTCITDGSDPVFRNGMVFIQRLY